jgi:hypothetical protein
LGGGVRKRRYRTIGPERLRATSKPMPAPRFRAQTTAAAGRVFGRSSGRVSLPVRVWGRLPGRRGPDSAATAAALLAALALFAGLALFGARWHWVEEAGSAERDGYVAQAEEILAGNLPRDPYRPALYPLLVAGLARLGLAPFTAARLLANAAAAGLALAAFAFGRRLAAPLASPLSSPGAPPPKGSPGERRAGRHAGTLAGGLAFAATAVNPNLWILGQHVTTDMPFAALAAGALLAGFAYLERPGRGAALAAGACLGLAAFTRANAWFLLPALAAAWWLASRSATRAGGGPHEAAAASVATGPATGAEAEPGGEGEAVVQANPAPGRRRLGDLALTAAAGLLLVLPHFLLRRAVFGDPFHDENWKNLAWKLHGHPDWSYLERVPFAGPGELLRADLGAILAGGIVELGRFLASGLGQLLGTPLHALVFAAGAAVMLAARPRAAGWLLGAGAVFLAGVAFSFFTWGRLLLVLLPLANALAFAPLGVALAGRWGGRRVGARALTAATLAAAALVAVLALVGVLAVKTAFYRLPAFVERHPYEEVAALRRLAEGVPPGTVLAGTSPFAGRYLDRPYVAVPDAFGPEVGAPERYLSRLRRLLAEERVAYLVIGAGDLRDRPPSLLAEEPPAPWLHGAGQGKTVRVWRVSPIAGEPPPEAASGPAGALASTCGQFAAGRRRRPEFPGPRAPGPAPLC